jgi:CRISPR-associated endonuclease/helicase Cas3
MLSRCHFAAFHSAVHGGQRPFAWQQRLLDQIVDERAWPRVLDLPTGAGKTTCIDIALFALALDASEPESKRWCPRRIVMVVDRRVIVDQAAERGRALLRALMTSDDPIVQEVAKRLRSLSGGAEEPLGVFTLRGGIPKDDGWARTPDQPLIIASTVDQVGSRMLMQGYGVSPGMKPVHAGLLANDTLLLLDEVHLSEPFRQTLDQLACLRRRFASNGLPKRFFHTFLSATPGDMTGPVFALLEEEKKPDSPLGPRLHARKPVRLIEVGDHAALEEECVGQARDLVKRHRTIAVIVNSVASAVVIARKLADTLRSEARVTLLTGRMRPLDRDDVLRELLPAVQTGRQRRNDSPKHVVVATQCIEAGADLDFDALVTEAASLDSLRQRFGRVDRLGTYGKAEGVIVFDASDQKNFIYGEAIVRTVKWLKEQERERPKKLKAELNELKKQAEKLEGDARQQIEEYIERRKWVDFGVLALQVPHGDDLTKLLAPKPAAPTLLPAYLDLWAQSSPPPCQLPEVSLWLHGPNADKPMVQVVWRADLSEEVLQRNDVETATAIVAAIPPSSLEAMSLPFVIARAWLANRPERDSFGDTEGAAPAEGNEPGRGGRRALRWQGEDSEIVDAATLKPGDTIVVPASYGGIRNGCFDAAWLEPVSDRAEQAELFARARPVLRLHPAVLGSLGVSLPLDDPEEARAQLGRLASTSDWPAWKKVWAEMISKGRGSFVVPGEPPWTVIYAGRVPLSRLREVLSGEGPTEGGVELTTDADASYLAGRRVSLAEHSENVERYAREYATRCGLDSWLTEHIAMAGWLHDIGKADPRFQLLLRGGSEIELFKDETVLAKSAMPLGSFEAHQRARQKSGYPPGARHEVQSVQMLHGKVQELKDRLKQIDPAKEPDIDLVLHLVASHHGYCRPFAPAVFDEKPVKVSLQGHKSEKFGSIDVGGAMSDNGLHRLDSPLVDRFWGLVAKYGWLELCWLEAVLRLADHRASEAEQSKDA